jgi:two-component system response regulator HupR/HoxA
MKYLVAYDWPGNIRELDNEVKKLVLLAGDDHEIGPAMLSNKLLASEPTKPPESDDVARGDGHNDPVFDDRYSLYDYLASHEKRFIVRALRDRKGIKKHAASLLRIPESTLRLKIKQYGIDLNNLDAVN